MGSKATSQQATSPSSHWKSYRMRDTCHVAFRLFVAIVPNLQGELGTSEPAHHLPPGERNNRQLVSRFSPGRAEQVLRRLACPRTGPRTLLSARVRAEGVFPPGTCSGLPRCRRIDLFCDPGDDSQVAPRSAAGLFPPGSAPTTTTYPQTVSRGGHADEPPGRRRGRSTGSGGTITTRPVGFGPYLVPKRRKRVGKVGPGGERREPETLGFPALAIAAMGFEPMTSRL
jgi:hypothetical protein